MELDIPEGCLVLLIGASSAGKTTFAQRHFGPTEIVSSDALRRMVSDDENDQHASGDAFDLLRHIVAARLKRGLLTVVDATNTRYDDRRLLLSITREHYVQPAAIVFDLPEEIAQERNQRRPDRNLPSEVIHGHVQQVERSMQRLCQEGFTRVYRLASVEEMEAASIRRTRLNVDYRGLFGPFDIIGDVHGCTDELEELLAMLGYTKITPHPLPSWSAHPYSYTQPAGRTAVFVGDLVDRGPRILDAWELVFHMCASGAALAVPGNHDDKLMRWLKGSTVEVANGLEDSLAAINSFSSAVRPENAAALRAAMRAFFEALPSHLVLDGGRLVVAHAGVKQRMIGRDARRVRDFALYGEVRGETDEHGLPIRYNWAIEYHGEARIVYGHTPVQIPFWQNNTINIDTGCVYGGRLTALRYPELELISVPARRVYHQPKRPIGTGMVPSSGAQQSES